MATETSAAAVSGTEDRVVISLQAPRKLRLTWNALSIILSVASVAWIVLSPSWASIIYGGFMIGALAWVWGTRLAARRARRGAPPQIVATTDGISSPIWSMPWARVARIWIGPTAAGSMAGSRNMQALHIEPMRPDDIAWTPSKTLRFNARVSDAMKMAPVQIPQVNVDRPLASIAADFERLAGRPLR